MESGNQGYLKAQEEIKKLKLNTESAQQARDQFLNQLLERSNTLKAKLIKLSAGDKGKKLNPNTVLEEVEQGAA